MGIKIIKDEETTEKHELKSKSDSSLPLLLDYKNWSSCVIHLTQQFVIVTWMHTFSPCYQFKDPSIKFPGT